MRERVMRLVADVAPGERAFTAAMFAYLFLVTATFWILKPLKKALFIEYYDASGLDLAGRHLAAAEGELIAKLLNVVVAALAVAGFTWLARRLRRHVLSMTLAAGFVAAFALFGFALERPRDGAVWSFYLFGDLFSTVMVAAFFAFLNDTVAPAASKRLYGPIVAGGVGGGVFGALALGTWIEHLTPPAWLAVCAAGGGAIAGMAFAAGRAARALPPATRSADEPARPEPEPAKRNAALEGAALVVRSRYLLAVVAIVTLYEIVSTIMDFQFTSTVAHYFEGPAIGRHLARVFAVTNVASLLVQVFLTSAIMRRFGVGTALLVLPSSALAASLAFFAAPGLWIGSLLNTADNAFSYSINQSAKEALYTPTSRDEKYKAKAFIDMFGQRLAKTIGIVASLGMSQWFAAFASLRWLSLVSVAVIGVWIVAARYAGRVFAAREAGSEGDVQPRAAEPGRDRDGHARPGRDAGEAPLVVGQVVVSGPRVRERHQLPDRDSHRRRRPPA